MQQSAIGTEQLIKMTSFDKIHQKSTEQNCDQSNEEETNYETFEGFYWDQYFLFMFYHFLFFYITGPFTFVVLAPFTGLKILRNLRFFGLSLSFFQQSLLWAMNVATIASTEFIIGQGLYFVQVYMMFSTTLLSILTVSAKYGTFSREKMGRWKNNVLDDKEIIKEYVLGGWNQQKEDIVEEEIKLSMQRKDIDSAIFQVDFLGDLEPELVELLKSYSMYYKERTKSFIPLEEMGSDDPEKFHGFGIIRYLVDQYRQQNNMRGLVAFGFALTVARSILPFILAMTNDPQFNQPIIWWILEGIFVFINIINFARSALLLILHLKDCLRKVFFMEQLSYLIAPRRFDGFQGKKIFPTINILDPLTLKSWMSMRKLLMDYGKRIDFRLQIDLANCLLFYIVILLVIALNLITVDSSEQIMLLAGKIIIFMEVSLMIFLAFASLIKGAQINKYYKIHKNVLMENRIFYLDVLRKTPYYIGDSAIKPNNYLYKFCIKNIGNQMEPSLENVRAYLKQLNCITEEAMEDLEFDQKNYPFRVFGITTTNEFLASIGIGLISAGASAINSILNRSSTSQLQINFYEL